MKNRIMMMLAVAFAAVACVDPNPQIEFGVDTDNINIGAASGDFLPARPRRFIQPIYTGLC